MKLISITSFFIISYICFSSAFYPKMISPRRMTLLTSQKREFDSYETSSASSRGFVSSLTGIVNFFMKNNQSDDISDEYPAAPRSPQELMKTIEQDYTVNNYLWTGDICITAFEPDCKFTDPTISFKGRQQYVSNVKNLVPIVEFLTNKRVYTNDNSGPSSKLLDIILNDKEGYVETRWNMFGELDALPWKPVIDVIGRTKFWYNQTEECCRVFFYDEKWEIEAGAALKQIITPGRIKPKEIVES